MNKKLYTLKYGERYLSDYGFDDFDRHRIIDFEFSHVDDESAFIMTSDYHTMQFIKDRIEKQMKRDGWRVSSLEIQPVVQSKEITQADVNHYLVERDMVAVEGRYLSELEGMANKEIEKVYLYPPKQEVPAWFDAWFKDIKADILDEANAKSKALMLINQVGYGHAFEDVHGNRMDAQYTDEVLSNAEKYSRAILDGYRVEEPELYRVVDKENQPMLYKVIKTAEHTFYEVGEVIPSYERQLYNDHTDELTEHEIKAYDERLWMFAEPADKEAEKMTKINQKEYEILKGLDDRWKWIVRTERGSIKTFLVRPHKDTGEWLSDGKGNFGIYSTYSDLFQFIQWEDEEPYNIPELIEEYEYSTDHVSHVAIQ